MKTTIERLNAALAKTEEGEEQLKVAVSGLSKDVSNKQLFTQELQVEDNALLLSYLLLMIFIYCLIINLNFDPGATGAGDLWGLQAVKKHNSSILNYFSTKKD